MTNSKIVETSFRTSRILTLSYQQFSNLLISQRDMSGPRLGALSNNMWSEGIISDQWNHARDLQTYSERNLKKKNFFGGNYMWGNERSRTEPTEWTWLVEGFETTRDKQPPQSVQSGNVWSCGHQSELEHFLLPRGNVARASRVTNKFLATAGFKTGCE
jgi:hypothetical protein